MPCTPNCGACCDPVNISDWQANRAFAFGPAAPQADWIWLHWEPFTTREDGAVLFRCANYDVEERKCLAYDKRPPVCKGFPFYGREPNENDVGINVCGYQAELGRTVLPLVEIR